MALVPTAAQTIGPFFSVGLDWPDGANLAAAGAAGEFIRIEGQVRDGDGTPVPDAMIEIWQANHEGRYAHPEDRQNKPLDPVFTGFGRVGTSASGLFRFHTIKPGAVPAPAGGRQAPHILVGVLARGLLKRLVTRIYFAGEAANESDPVLAFVPAARRATLMAQPLAGEPGGYRWDVVLQGDGETVFFDC